MIKTPTRSYLFFAHRLQQLLPVVCLLLAALFATQAQAALTVTRTSSPVIYTNSGYDTATTSPKCNYLSFNITGAALDDAWAKLDLSSAPLLSLGGTDDGIFHIGPMAASETKAAFFYVCSTHTGKNESSAQPYDIKIYSDKSSLVSDTATSTVSVNDTTIFDDVIVASANKVVAVWAGTSNDELGTTATLTVDGDTGTVGCITDWSTCTGAEGGPLAFSPATFTGWRADAYELVKSSIVFSGGNNGTYTDTLNFDSFPSSADSHYVATYSFRPILTTASSVPLSPVSYLASGTKIKHTPLDSIAGASFPASNFTRLTKSVSHATLPAQGGTVTYTLSAINTGSLPVTMDSFVDTLPADAVYVSGTTTFNNVSFPDPSISGSTLEWSSFFTIPAGATRSLIFQATLPAMPATYTNSAIALIGNTVVDTTLDGSNAPATASTVVLEAPTISKAFSPTAMAIDDSSTLTLTIGNPNVAHALNGIAISDTLPASPTGLVFDTPPNAATTCTGAALSISGTTISISGGTLTVGQSCTVSVQVTSSVNNSIYINTTGEVSSSNGGTGLTASATLTTTPKPTISKAFSVATIPVDGTATLSFIITNNTPAAITGMEFTDTYPVDLVNAATPGVTNTCGGTITAVAGAGSLSLSDGGIVAVGGTCAISVDVTSATMGDYANTSDGVNSNESSPAGPVSNTAVLSVLAPPTVTKAFSSSPIGIGQTSTLTVTLANPNAAAITGAAFTDNYPAGLINETPANVTSTCGGTVTAADGGGSLILSGGIIPGGSCEISVDVTSASAADYINTLNIGDVTTSNANSNTVAASDTLTVNTTPTINKSFSFDPVTGIGAMDITIINNDGGPITGLYFTDEFPTGMSTDNPPALSSSCGGTVNSWDGATAGTLSATGGDPGISLTGGSIVAAGSCTITINLTVNALGVYNNQTSVSTGSFGTGSASNIATWIAPAVGKNFTPTQVTPTTLGPSDISRLVITITNPSLTTSLTGLRITDVFPITATKLAGGSLTASITTSPAPNGTTTCTGGAIEAWDGTTATPLNAGGGDVGIIMTGGTLAPGASCSIEIDVYATNTTPALYSNVTGNVTSDQGIGTSGSDSLIITTKPTIEKSFLVSPESLTTVTATGTVMRIVVENNSGGDITDVEFSDIFPTSPSQMVWENTVSNGCSGTLTDDADAPLVAGTSTSIKLTGGSILSVAPATCTIDITVSATASGSYFNTTSGAISSSNAEVGPASNTAELVVHLDPPTATKTFANAGFQVDHANTLTITLTNPNTEAITSMAFTDTYPANLVNAPTPSLTNDCGGTATAAAGVGSLNITGATIPASSFCTIEVDITATAPGVYTNTLTALAVTSANADPGPVADVTADTTAYLPPVLVKSFAAGTIGIGASTTLSLTLTNPASNPDAITDVQVDDTFPTGMTLDDVVFSYIPAACGTVTRTDDSASVAGDGAIRFKVASLAAGVSCEALVNITSSTSGAVTNTTGVPVATAAASLAALSGTTAWDSIIVQSAPSITVLKSVLTISDPVNLLANPKAIPGAVVQYMIISTNSGAGSADIDSTVVIDPIVNAILYAADIGGPGPVLFAEGATPSTLTFNSAVDVTYSDDGGTTWTATPSPDGVTGCDTSAPAITHIRVNPKGAFVGDPVPPSPSFLITFRVCVQ